SPYNKNIDYLTVLPIFSLFVCILMFFCFGFSWSLLIASSISLICLICNIRQLRGFIIKLKKEKDDPYILGTGIFLTILLVAYLVVICIFCPPYLKECSHEKQIYTGSEKAGFVLKDNIFTKTSALVEIYYLDEKPKEAEAKRVKLEKIGEKTEAQKNNYMPLNKNPEEVEKNEIRIRTENEFRRIRKPAVVYIPDVFTNAQDAVGTLTYLAERGYDVYSFSFYDDKVNYFESSLDSRYFSPAFLRREKFKNPEKIEEKKDYFERYAYNQYKKCAKLMMEMGIAKFYILAEGHSIEAAKLFESDNPAIVMDIYAINQDNSIPDYIDGFANLQTARPMESRFLGLKFQRNWYTANIIANFADKKFRGE
ncbi:MAG: hypothetical protein K5839_04165, partial [Treponemataceae bacterium]|nr:hypothetical protein [Treponemataceae bacterium]